MWCYPILWSCVELRLTSLRKVDGKAGASAAVQLRTELWNLQWNAQPAEQVMFSPQNKYLFAAYHDGRLLQWLIDPEEIIKKHD